MERWSAFTENIKSAEKIWLIAFGDHLKKEFENCHTPDLNELKNYPCSYVVNNCNFLNET